jgi:hypothetical protein
MKTGVARVSSAVPPLGREGDDWRCRCRTEMHGTPSEPGFVVWAPGNRLVRAGSRCPWARARPLQFRHRRDPDPAGLDARTRAAVHSALADSQPYARPGRLELEVTLWPASRPVQNLTNSMNQNESTRTEGK